MDLFGYYFTLNIYSNLNIYLLSRSCSYSQMLFCFKFCISCLIHFLYVQKYIRSALTSLYIDGLYIMLFILVMNIIFLIINLLISLLLLNLPFVYYAISKLSIIWIFLNYPHSQDCLVRVFFLNATA